MGELIKEELVAKAKKGDIEAFSKLYEEIYIDLYKLALYTLNNSSDAEDIVSETVVAAFEGISKLKNGKLFKNWIIKILINKCRKFMKKKKVVNLESLEEALYTDFEENYDVKEAFKKLSYEERMILSLVVFSGYSSYEVSEILNIKSNTVRSKQSRALGKLRNILGNE